jgi:hypothetical protein
MMAPDNGVPVYIVWQQIHFSGKKKKKNTIYQLNCQTGDLWRVYLCVELYYNMDICVVCQPILVYTSHNTYVHTLSCVSLS